MTNLGKTQDGSCYIICKNWIVIEQLSLYIIWPNLILGNYSNYIYHDNYHEIIQTVEEAFSFFHFHTPLLDKIHFSTKPTVLVISQYSIGKT